MNSFRRYENGMIKEEDLLDRNIIRPWKKLLIKDFSKEESDMALAESLKDIFVAAKLKGWTAAEESSKSDHLNEDNLLLIKATIEEIKSKKGNVRSNSNSHILHYWRDEASPELKNKVYELFNLYEKVYG